MEHLLRGRMKATPAARNERVVLNPQGLQILLTCLAGPGITARHQLETAALARPTAKIPCFRGAIELVQEADLDSMKQALWPRIPL